MEGRSFFFEFLLDSVRYFKQGSELQISGSDAMSRNLVVRPSAWAGLPHVQCSARCALCVLCGYIGVRVYLLMPLCVASSGAYTEYGVHTLIRSHESAT